MSEPTPQPLEIVTGDAVGHWVAERVGGKFNPVMGKAIGQLRGERIVAAVIFENWNRRSITCHIAVEGAVSRRFLRAIGRYAFDICEVHKVIGPVGSGNAAALDLDKRLGFVEEARIKDAHPDGDLVLLTVTRDTYRFIGDKHGFEERSAAGR